MRRTAVAAEQARKRRGALARVALRLPRFEPRFWCHRIVTGRVFNPIFFLVVVVNCATLAAESTVFCRQNYGWYMAAVDQVFLGAYLLEAASKIYAHHWHYFRSKWNTFDFCIFASSMAFFLLSHLVHGVTQKTNFVSLLKVLRTFRALRSLRALRTIAFLRSMQSLVETLVTSITAISSIAILSVILLCIFAAIGRTLYADSAESPFASIGSAFFRLLAMLTLDDWSVVWHKNRDSNPSIFYYLVVFIIIQALVLLNLFVAVLYSNLAAARAKSKSLPGSGRNALRVLGLGRHLTPKQLQKQFMFSMSDSTDSTRALAASNTSDTEMPKGLEHESHAHLACAIAEPCMADADAVLSAPYTHKSIIDLLAKKYAMFQTLDQSAADLQLLRSTIEKVVMAKAKKL